MKEDNASPLVSVEWLVANRKDPNVVILEASLPKPKSKPPAEETRVKIPNARIFEIEKNFSDPNTHLPHMMPSSEMFTEEAQKLGINQNNIIVVYDNLGVYSSPRAWWMFRAMGHEQVFVLDGGLPEWQKAGMETEPYNAKGDFKRGDFVAHYKPELIKDYRDVLTALQDKSQVVMDARSEDRFFGRVPEPREGLRLGHMPNAVNIPFDSIQHDTKMMNETELKEIFGPVASQEQQLIFSCGSGVTACVLALGAALAGYKNISVYDGSWSEWGLPSDLPVVGGNKS